MSVLNLRLGLQFVVDAAGSGWVCRISVEDEKKTFSAFFKARTLAPTTNYLTAQCFSTRVPPILYWDFNVFVDEVLRLQKRSNLSSHFFSFIVINVSNFKDGLK